MTTGCSLEDCLDRKKITRRKMPCFEPGHQGRQRLSISGCFHTQLHKPYVAWALDSLELLFKGLTR